MRTVIALALATGTAAADPAISIKGHVGVTLTAIQAEVDRQVPPSIEKLDDWEMSGAVGYRFGVWRDPIQLSTDAHHLVAATHFEYGVAGCVAGFGSCHQIASCGIDEAHATVDVQISASGAWQPDWTIKPSLSLTTKQGRACKLTRINLDASKVVLAALQPALQAGMALFGQSIDVRAYAQDLWAKVPATQLGPDLWLAWNVARVVVGPLQYSADAIGSDVEIDVTPRLVEGSGVPANGPLPGTLDTTGAPGGNTLGLELVATWPDLESMFASVVGTVSVAGTQVKLLHVTGNEAGIQVELEGSAARVTAQLVYDEATDDLHATNVKVGAGETFVEKAMASALEPSLHVQLRPLVTRHLQAIDQALSANHVAHPSLAKGVEQHVSITGDGAHIQLAVPGALAIAPTPATKP